MIKFLISFVLFFIPRYTTDDVALATDENGDLQVYCLKGQENLGDEMYIEAYGLVKTFTFMGWCSGGKCHIYKRKY